MIGKLVADLNFLDPDVIVCHDSSKILDVLIQRMAQLGDKNTKPKLGRLVHMYHLNALNQYQRISSSLAGRLIVDTFIHSKDMIRSVDYELESMAKYIKPEKAFVGMADEEVSKFLNEGNTFYVLKKIKEEAETTFALMNHL
jgi:DNA polymerase elongation subunit (family B)